MRIPSQAVRLVACVALAIQACGPAGWAVAAVPTVTGVAPEPGFINQLGSVRVTFSEPVNGVRAGDFLVNGVPATGVEGTGAQYIFHLAPPAFGPVDVTWGPLHTIFSVAVPSERFDSGAAGSTWAYQLINPAPPKVTGLLPIPSATLRKLAQVEVNFDRPVLGVDAPDLRLNGAPALGVSGVGAGPYRFSFEDAGAGLATLAWVSEHGIVADDPGAAVFVGTSWGYTIDPDQPAPCVVLNEIVAENQSGLLDEEGDTEDWLELRNCGAKPVNLEGWSLSVDREEEGQWVFPETVIPPGGYLLVWVSGKDRRESGFGQNLHTNFKLNAAGDTVRLFGPELPRTLVDELKYPEQAPDYSYGRLGAEAGARLSFLARPTPGTANVPDEIIGKVEEVHFSVERGFFNAPFNLTLACPTAGAEIRYTLNGSPPALTNGFVFDGPILIGTTRVVRAAAFAPNRLPSRVQTHTYLMNLANNRRLLPVLSLVTATNNLYGRTGIMESNPRNTTKHGAAWERPVSVEWVRPEDNGGFQLDAGIRVAGGDYIRQRYSYRTTRAPEGKYSFRLYFRGNYGPGRLEYPLFPGSTLKSYNNVHVRAGMNDHTNPLMKDEFIRALSLDVGIAACHGTFVYLFLNGVYQGIYNPCERVDDDFLQAYHGGGELWDVMGPNNQAIRGDTTAWSQLRTAARKDLTVASNYLAVAARMDLTNFIDYLLPLVWADNDDWPHNNTRAAREKKDGTPFRFYPWDAEFAFSSHSVSYDTIAGTLSSLSPPWGTTDYQATFNALKKSPEFKLLFADRVHRAFFNGGPLTDERLRARYNAIKAQVAPSIPGFNDLIGTWINRRRPYIMNSFQRAGVLNSTNAPGTSQFGGRVTPGYRLVLTNLSGAILYTTDGTDPRVPFSGKASPSALEYTAPLVLNQSLHLKARSLGQTNWSALTEMVFEVDQAGSPLRITEIMFNPPGGSAYEYVEVQNTGGLPVDLSGCSLDGIRFRFPASFPLLAAGERIVVANDSAPADFERRYPGLQVAGWYDGALNDAGERVALLDLAGRMVASVTFAPEPPWPAAANGGGASLEVRDPLGDPDDPANWQASAPGGSPGAPNRPADAPVIRINELNAASQGDWIELFNPGVAPVSISGWSLTDDSNPRQWAFPAGLTIPAGGFIKIDCRKDAPAGSLAANFQLNRQGETVALFDASGNRVDVVRYGPAIDAHTVGIIDGRLTLCEPTPAAANRPASLGALDQVRINEFLANSDDEVDWIEFHNAGGLPASLQGCVVLTSNALARIAAPVFIGAGGFVALWADELPGPDHLNLKITAGGGRMALLAPDGSELDQVIYAAQSPSVSTGRYPDGIGAFQAFPFSPTRGAANQVVENGTRVRIAEFMARPAAGPVWVEIENVSPQAMELGGFTIGIQARDAALEWHAFRTDARLNAGARMLLYFGTLPGGFIPKPGAQIFPGSLSGSGGRLTLRDERDRILDYVEYGPQISDRSAGRTASGWTLLAAASPGEPNGLPAPIDAGSSVRINEWLAAASGASEFIELFNPSVLPVDLGGWVLTDDPSIHGSTNQRLAPLTFIDALGHVRFDAEGAPDHLPFRLAQLGETIRLLDRNGRTIDSVDFAVQLDGISEGRYPDAAAEIMRFPGSASPGAANYLAFADADGDGMEDSWERNHGLNPALAEDAFLDTDGDGMSNADEYRSGTDPRDAASVLRLEFVDFVAGGPVIRFAAQANRAYRVESADSLAGASWHSLAEIPVSSAPRDIEVTDPNAPRDGTSVRFYRVTTAP